ncbi:MAG: dihydroxy-acid dehydratase [Candidatus Omnitrophica bacterium]|nr:dihydroxy-acid dehydratase [Candidatus Omnitrophota bacterium]
MATARKVKKLRIEHGPNYYSLEVQGKANEPICVAGVLNRAKSLLKKLPLEFSLDEIVDRLDYNAPRVAVIMGSPDHPAHVADHETSLMAAASLWRRGAVPFLFGVPVICDGTAQSTPGMSGSLASRNLVSAMVVNQMEGHNYHGAFVIQGCDKTPCAIVNALASLDLTRRRRGEAPVFASFAPAHVMRGGVLPVDLKDELLEIADQADCVEEKSLGDDLRYTIRHILQCSSNQAFQGVFARAVQTGLITKEKHKELEKRLAVHTCPEQGGICAFNGTGNSSRYIVASLGLVHPALEFLTKPPTFEQIDDAVAAMLKVCNNPLYSVSNIVLQNIENAVRIHSAMGASTNLMMHLISCMIYAGRQFSIHDYDRIRRRAMPPDLMNYSLTEGRDIFALAQQCGGGLIRGVETMLYELKRNKIPIAENAPTMAAKSWAQRLRQGKRLAADNVKSNQIILSKPKRGCSGVDVLKGNFFESAVIKISGMPDPQLDAFDEKIAVALYFETEEDAVSQLLNIHILDAVLQAPKINRDILLQLYAHNAGRSLADPDKIRSKKDLLQRLLDDDAFRMAVIVAGQGPQAFGMPEMFTPMQHINHNQSLKKIAALISDGRYSGVSYGAAVGHVTPEALNQGGILFLQTGDLLHLRLRKRTITLLDPDAFRRGKRVSYKGKLNEKRQILGRKRLKQLAARRKSIDPANLMNRVTDAARGVVPIEVWDQASRKSR